MHRLLLRYPDSLITTTTAVTVPPLQRALRPLHHGLLFLDPFAFVFPSYENRWEQEVVVEKPQLGADLLIESLKFIDSCRTSTPESKSYIDDEFSSLSRQDRLRILCFEFDSSSSLSADGSRFDCN